MSTVLLIMRKLLFLCHLVFFLSTASASSPWADYVEAGRLDWEDLDRISMDLAGSDFHAYMSETPPYGSKFRTEEAGRAFFEAHVSHLIVGDRATQLALYTAYAEEASFRRDADSVLRISAFNGMNVSHRIVREMLNEMLSGVTVGPGGKLAGVGSLLVDLGSERNTTLVSIDFDRGVITPALEVEEALGGRRPVTVADISDFVSLFLPLATMEDDAIAIFVGMPDLPTIRHELLHALYAADAGHRQQVLVRARNASQVQREMAILFAAINYDVLDPDMPSRNRHIVLDEAFNAYTEEGRLDLDAGRSWFSIGDFERAHDIRFSLAAYDSIGALPVSDDEHTVLRDMYEYFAESAPELDERSFLEQHGKRVLDNVHCLHFLRHLLQEQHPDIYEQIVLARQALLDALI